MKPDKIEIDFKNKLDQREIKPSQQAWDRLDAMLSVAEEKKPNRKLPWIYIAASVIVFLSIGIGFFTENEKGAEVKNNEVVIENKQKIEDREIIKTELPIIVSPFVEEKITGNISKNRISYENKKVDEHKTNNNQNQIAENSIINQKTNPELIIPITSEVVVVENTTKLEKVAVQPNIKVDANNLLSQVDGELELTFREKVLQKVSKNYKTVKVALANRNQQ